LENPTFVHPSPMLFLVNNHRFRSKSLCIFRARSRTIEMKVFQMSFTGIFHALFLFLVFYAFSGLIHFVLQPDRDLIARPPFFFVVLMSLKLEWAVWEIKNFRFIVRFLITAIGLCPKNGSLKARLKWYRKSLLGTWRFFCILHDRDKKRK